MCNDAHNIPKYNAYTLQIGFWRWRSIPRNSCCAISTWNGDERQGNHKQCLGSATRCSRKSKI